MKQTPVLLLTGYLGSGKTTLVNHILSNKRNIKFAVIVNDIGEVNIDASLIQKDGIVNQQDDSLVPLQNGCICCTLKMDLVEQINDIMAMERFDYIVIEASGICEPAPIAQTICSIPTIDPKYTRHGIARLDCIATVVDALRLQSEFDCGRELTRKDIDEEDIENLVIQQIEFCNIILLNKALEVTPDELSRIRQILRAIQPKARIITCDYADVDLDLIINTGLFDFEEVATSAAWVEQIEREMTEEEEEEAHGHHHHEHEEEEDEHEHHEHEHHHGPEEEEHEHHHEDEDEHGEISAPPMRRPPRRRGGGVGCCAPELFELICCGAGVPMGLPPRPIPNPKAYMPLVWPRMSCGSFWRSFPTTVNCILLASVVMSSFSPSLMVPKGLSPGTATMMSSAAEPMTHSEGPLIQRPSDSSNGGSSSPMASRAGLRRSPMPLGLEFNLN